MVPKRIIDHVIASINQIPIRPIVVMCGDRQQQLPIDGTQHAHQVNSVFQHRRFFSMVHCFDLTVQYRCDDPEFQEILNHLCYHKPSQNLLNFIHDGRILTNSNDVTDAEIKLILLQHPESAVVAVTRNGTNRVNKVAVETLFESKTPLGIVQCDCELSPIPIYKDMNVIITQNRDKLNHVVNGQKATVHTVQRNTVFLKLQTGKIVNTYMVTYTMPDGQQKRVYPFVPC